ncbi:hypothetical protein BJI69_08195 [Luteibacter rhizovicinus DSM 16549]|uniref:Uncharacterized protein n=1 Tax=Luteibacter rhizovicinus DSM 16549 TaxID=1440763 RepID=A0A1L3ESD4_9GAMM|nr:hypothetical protein [Luteibacter rhizovicinus]APG03887.1 hypothetical protein BJI69_08195 [Luteibacter rhizovicinus DSM 16549]
MLDTLEMLEAIGSDASLRYASTVELTTVLEAGRASDALTAAVASGDSSHLAREFGNIKNFSPQVTQQIFVSSDID